MKIKLDGIDSNVSSNSKGIWVENDVGSGNEPLERYFLDITDECKINAISHALSVFSAECNSSLLRGFGFQKEIKDVIHLTFRVEAKFRYQEKDNGAAEHLADSILNAVSRSLDHESLLSRAEGRIHLDRVGLVNL